MFVQETEFVKSVVDAYSQPNLFVAFSSNHLI